MAILVDAITEYSREQTRGLPSTRWCHMVSTVDEHELHAFAKRIGMQRSWAQVGPVHYDLTPSKRALAVKLGAIEVSGRELVISNYDGAFRRAGRCEQGLDGRWQLKAVVQGNQ